jgi:hypothetical protein
LVKATQNQYNGESKAIKPKERNLGRQSGRLNPRRTNKANVLRLKNDDFLREKQAFVFKRTPQKKLIPQETIFVWLTTNQDYINK